MTGDSIAPPPCAERLLERTVASSPYAEDIAGDLYEAFNAVAGRRSLAFARWWYRAQVLALVVRFLFRIRRHPQRKGHLMDRLAMEARFAARSLLKRPGLTAAAAITLALGLGANAAVFGIIDALVVHPFNMPAVDRIVTISETSPNNLGTRRETVSPANFLDWRRDLAGTIDHLTAMEWWDVNLVGRDEPERALGFRVSNGFFGAVGVEPVVGRAFRADEETRGRDRVVVLSDGLWKRRFGADPSILGRPILANGAQMTVVGIMPAGFDFPQSSELWAPLSFDPSKEPTRSDRYLTVIGRLHDGRSYDEASAQLAVEVARLVRDFPKDNQDRSARMYPISRGLGDDGTERVLALWQAAALFVLLIACANIANLLLARGSERGREIAVRLALGSSRGRVVRESLVESVLLALVAVPFSLAVSWVFLTVIRTAMPARVMRFVAGWNNMRVDAPLVATTVALAVVAAVAFGLLPALQISRHSVSDALKTDGRGGAGPGRQRLRRALVVAEIALVLPLLVAAILSVRSVATLVTGSQGYDPDGVLVLKAALPEVRYPDVDSRRRFAVDTLDRIAALPSVETAVAANVLPSSDSGSSRYIEIEGRPPVDRLQRPLVSYRTVSDQFFTGLRLPILSGRGLSRADQPGATHVAVVSESLARKFWPDGNAIGARLRINDEQWMTIVGISGDVIHDWFEGKNAPTLYRPLVQAPPTDMMFAVRAKGDPAAIAPDVRRAIAQVDPAQPAFDVMPMRQAILERTIGLRFIAGVMGTFAALALVLAVLGLYAVMSYLVAQRVREIGVRIALGATTTDVTRLALGQAARLTAVGVGVGFVLAVALSRAMQAGLLGVIKSDLVTPIATAIVLGVTTLASSYLPARRAAAVDPMVALRTE
jgi:putative ABC transport system permease protein